MPRADQPEPPDEPPAQRHLVSDGTTQVMATILRKHCRGIQMARDEIAELAQRRRPESMSLDDGPEPRPCFGRIVNVIDIARDVAGVDRPEMAAVFGAITVVA